MTNKRQATPRTPEICPVCGEDVERGAVACPECGADHKSGWRENGDAYDGIDLPDEDFNYDEFVEQEFGSQGRTPSVKTIWWIAAAILFVAFLLICFRAVG